MQNGLYNILVPIDFTKKNKWAIHKAIEIANTFSCNVHLVAVADGSDNRGMLEALKEIKIYYAGHLCGKSTIEISITHGTLIQSICNYISQYRMDLLVVGCSKLNLLQRLFHSIRYSRISQRTDVPILAVTASGMIYHFKKILLPLHGQVPLSRIRVAALLGRQFKSTLYVLAMRSSDSQADSQAIKLLQQTIELIQSITTIPVQAIFLEGRNLAASTLHFAEKINADLILISPAKKMNLSWLWNGLTRRWLSYFSKRPLLSIGQPDQ